MFKNITPPTPKDFEVGQATPIKRPAVEHEAPKLALRVPEFREDNKPTSTTQSKYGHDEPNKNIENCETRNRPELDCYVN